MNKKGLSNSSMEYKHIFILIKVYGLMEGGVFIMIHKCKIHFFTITVSFQYFVLTPPPCPGRKAETKYIAAIKLKWEAFFLSFFFLINMI